jgi:hypothetical protein
MQRTIWIVSIECPLTTMITAGADPEAAMGITFAIIQASALRIGKLNSMNDLYFAGWQMQPSQSITKGDQLISLPLKGVQWLVINWTWRCLQQ